MELKNFERTNKEGKKYYFFPSVSDLANLIKENRDSKYNFIDSSEKFAGEYDDFYGTKDMDEAIHLAEYGWLEGTKRLNKEITVHNVGLDYKNDFSVVGSHVSVPRYLNGHPQNMIRKVPVSRVDKVINLVRFSSVTGGTTSHSMIEGGIKFVQLVQKLESQGYRCNVDVVFASRYSPEIDHFVRVRIKNSNERLNIAKMSFAMCHPSMFRRFIFKLRYMEYKTCERFKSWNTDGRDINELRNCEMKAAPYLNNNDYFIPMFIDPETFELKKVA